jgi:hypothetical protein
VDVVTVLLVVLIWVVLMGFFAAWTFWFQGYLYTQPVEQLYWRAPAAGSAITFFLIIWITIDYRAVKNDPKAHSPYAPIGYTWSPPQTNIAPFQTLFVPPENNPKGEPKEYTRTKAASGPDEYRHGQERIPGRPAKVIIDENGEKSVFEPDRDEKGHFKTGKGLPLYYRDDKGRVLEEITFNPVQSYRVGPMILGLFLNAMFFLVWFICMWLLLRYQLWHAIGLTVAMSAVMLLFVITPVMSYAEKGARPPPVEKPTE